MNKLFTWFALLLVLVALLNPVICGGADDDDDNDELSDSEKAPAPPVILGASPQTLTASDFVDGFNYSPLTFAEASLLIEA